MKMMMFGGLGELITVNVTLGLKGMLTMDTCIRMLFFSTEESESHFGKPQNWRYQLGEDANEVLCTVEKVGLQTEQCGGQ